MKKHVKQVMRKSEQMRKSDENIKEVRNSDEKSQKKCETHDENKIKFITDMMLKYQIDKIAKQKMDIYFDEGMKTLSSISSKKNKILELKNYFEKMRERKF